MVMIINNDNYGDDVSVIMIICSELKASLLMMEILL